MEADGESSVGFARANTFRDAIAAAVIEPEVEAPVEAEAAAEHPSEGVVIEAGPEPEVMADKIEKVKKARAKAKLLKKLKDDRRKQDREVEAEIQSERQKLARRISAENGAVAATHGEVAGADTRWTRKLKHRDTLKQLKKDKSGANVGGPLPLGPVEAVAEDGAEEEVDEEEEEEEEVYEDEEAAEEAEKQAVSSTGLSLQSSDSDFDLKLNLLRRARSKAKLMRSQTERKELQAKIKLVERARAKARLLRKGEEKKQPEQAPVAQEGEVSAQSLEGVAGESEDAVAALPAEEFEQRVNLLKRARSRAKLIKAEQEQKDLEHKIELLEKARSKAKLIKQASLSKVASTQEPEPAPAAPVEVTHEPEASPPPAAPVEAAAPEPEASAAPAPPAAQPESDHISPEELENRIQLLKKARTKAQLLRKEEEERKDLEVKKGLVSKALAKGKLLKQASLSKAKMAPAPDADGEDEDEPGESTEGVSAAELNTRIKLLKKARARAKKLKAAEEEKELQLKITLLQKARSKAKLIKSQSQDNTAAAGEQSAAADTESAELNHKIKLVRKARAKAKMLKELEKERKQADAAVEHEVEEAEKENEIFHTSKHAFQASLLIEAETKKLMRGDALVSPKHADVVAASAQVHRGSVLAASIAEVPEAKEEEEKGEDEVEEEPPGGGEDDGEDQETGGETGAAADPRATETGEANEVETGIAEASIEEKRAVVQAIRESEQGAKHAREADLKEKVALVRKARAQAKQLKVRKEVEAEVRARQVREAREHEQRVQREHSLLHKYQPKADAELEEALRAEYDGEGDEAEAVDQFDADGVPVEVDVVAFVSVRPSADSFMRPSQSAYSLAEEIALEAMEVSADDRRMHSDGDLGSLEQHLADEWKKQAEAFEWGIEGEDGFVLIDGDLAAMIPSEAYVLSDKQWTDIREREKLLAAALEADAGASTAAPVTVVVVDDVISESGRALSSVSLISRNAPSPPPNSTYSGVSARSLDSPSSGRLVVPSPMAQAQAQAEPAERGAQWKEAVDQRTTAMNSQQAEVDNLLRRISKVTKVPDPAGPKAGTDIPSNLPPVSTDDLRAESENLSARGAPKEPKVTPYGDLIAAAEADLAKEADLTKESTEPPLQNEIGAPPSAATEDEGSGRLCSRKDGRGICQCVVM